MNNKSKKGLRPFQPVIYVTEAIYDQLDWKGHALSDLFSFDKVITSLSDEDILTFLSLNSSDPSKSILLQYPFAIGIDNIFREWNIKVLNTNDEKLHSDLKRIKDSVRLNIHHTMALTSLAVEVEEPTEESDGFKIVHDESIIFVVIKKNDRNLLNVKSLNKTIKSMVREIIKTYTYYSDYSQISTTPWFNLYIEKL